MENNKSNTDYGLSGIIFIVSFIAMGIAYIKVWPIILILSFIVCCVSGDVFFTRYINSLDE
jgi:hypothetical protein